jgi:NAD(P)-dependent dehydrogenase (short-subunit alcohol dehydrogenase family)
VPTAPLRRGLDRVAGRTEPVDYRRHRLQLSGTHVGAEREAEVDQQELAAGRIGEPSEIAAAVVYLASAASTYVTGAILSIDGGYTAW